MIASYCSKDRSIRRTNYWLFRTLRDPGQQCLPFVSLAPFNPSTRTKGVFPGWFWLWHLLDAHRTLRARGRHLSHVLPCIHLSHDHFIPSIFLASLAVFPVANSISLPNFFFLFLRFLVLMGFLDLGREPALAPPSFLPHSG